ncbi:unnamed protein product [Penicillium bialowiezense]
MPSVTYQYLPGPVGDCLKPSSLATTATIPLSPTASLVVTTGHLGLDLETGQLVNSSAEAEFNAIFSCLDAALKNAGIVEGLLGAYKFVSYLQRFLGHTPTWSTVIVKEINVSTMRAEIAAEGVLFSH